MDENLRELIIQLIEGISNIGALELIYELAKRLKG